MDNLNRKDAWAVILETPGEPTILGYFSDYQLAQRKLREMHRC